MTKVVPINIEQDTTNQEDESETIAFDENESEICPQSKDISLSSTLNQQQKDQQKAVREMRLSEPSDSSHRGSFLRFMSMNTLQSMSPRHLFFKNKVFRGKCAAIVINVMARICTLGMNVLLILLSLSYCIAHLSSARLVLLDECEPKTLQDIYQHSLSQAAVDDNGIPIINEVSQWGWTNTTCMTTKKYQQHNMDSMWYSNRYEHEWRGTVDYGVILFGMLSLYSFGILVYNLISIATDLYHLRHNTLHTLSEKTRRARESLDLPKNSRRRSVVLQVGPIEENKIQIQWMKFKRFLDRLLETDTTLWVIRLVAVEIVEFLFAVYTLCLYNGYYVLDPNNENDIYLAERPHFIVMFTIFMAVNMFGSAMLWMSYAAAPETCNGLTFRTALFFVEDLSDLFYTLFPLIVIRHETYNENVSWLVVFGLFEVEWKRSLSTLFYLSTLCLKTHHLVYSSYSKLRDRYHSELYLEDGDTNWIQEDDPHEGSKRAFLMLISALYILAAIISSFMVGIHINDAAKYCNSISEASFMKDAEFRTSFRFSDLTEDQQLALSTNPELFFFDKCLFPTYPFVSGGGKNNGRCQCRVFVIDWNDLESTMEDRERLGLTQNKVLFGLLQNNIMLEKLRTIGIESADKQNEVIFKETMRMTLNTLEITPRHLTSLEWKGSDEVSLSTDWLGIHIASWKKLQYLSVDGVSNLDIGHLSTLNILNVKFQSDSTGSEQNQTAIQVTLNSICSAGNLQVITLQGPIQYIPHCFADLNDLKVFIADNTMELHAFPTSMLQIPSLDLFSVFKGNVTLDALLKYNDYNLQDVVDFAINYQTEIYFQLNPICADDLTTVQLADGLREWIKSSCAHPCGHTSNCSPRLMADGQCDEQCNSMECHFDGMDCLQLCMVNGLTECSSELLLNSVCDEQCNNAFCSGFGTESTSQSLPDFGSCDDGEEESEETVSCELASNPAIECQSEWRGDMICDSSCNIAECHFDDGDCRVSFCDGLCAVTVGRWIMVDLSREFKLSHSAFCSDSWLNVQRDFGSFQGSDNCLQTLESVDFNDDQFVNLKEYTAMMYQIQNGFDGSRYRQIDCSSCLQPILGVGKHYYDI